MKFNYLNARAIGAQSSNAYIQYIGVQSGNASGWVRLGDGFHAKIEWLCRSYTVCYPQ